MDRSDATKIHYLESEIFGQFAFFTQERIDPDTIPEGYSLYELKHDDHKAPCGIHETSLYKAVADLSSYCFTYVKQNYTLTNNFYGSIIVKDEKDYSRPSLRRIFDSNLSDKTDMDTLPSLPDAYNEKIWKQLSQGDFKILNFKREHTLDEYESLLS